MYFFLYICIIFGHLLHEDINQKKNKIKIQKVFGISKNNIICAKSRQGTYYFFKKENEESFGIFKNIQLLEMESYEIN